jgi:hypothetical protein
LLVTRYLGGDRNIGYKRDYSYDLPEFKVKSGVIKDLHAHPAFKFFIQKLAI